MKGTIKSYGEVSTCFGEERSFILTINIKGEEALEFLWQIQKEKEVNIIPSPIFIPYEKCFMKPTISKYFWEKEFEKIRQFCCKPKTEVIFNEPATVLYKDGKKCVCKCDKEDKFSEELGLALCLLKSFGVSYSDFEELLKGAKRQGVKNEKNKN